MPLDEASLGRGGRGASPPPRSRRSPSACSSRSCTRSTSGASARRCGGAAGRARVALQRAAARVPRVRALLDHGRERVPRARRSSRTSSELEPQPLVMQSSGGVVDAAAAAARPAACVLSGPAAGVVGAAFVAAGRRRDVLTFDMGGTSTDVAAVLGGEVQVTADVGRRRACRSASRWSTSTRSARAAARSPGSTTAARCGSGRARRARARAGLLRPRRHAADGHRREPRPRLPRATAPCSAARCARPRAAPSRRWGARARSARGLRSASSRSSTRMARALRVVSVERGIDPRGLALVAFGGAGPLHACALAEELGIERVLVPRASGVLSALGLAAADLRRDYVAPPRSRSWRRARPRDLPGATSAAGRRRALPRPVARADGRGRRLGAHLARGARAPLRLPAGRRAEIVTRRLVATLARPRARLRAGTDRRHGPGPPRVPRRRPARPAGARPGRGRHRSRRSSSCPARPVSSAPAGPGAPDAAGTLVLERTWTR